VSGDLPRPSDRPPDYPLAYERRLTLGDGRRVQVRPILPSDAPELAAAIRDADPADLRARFLGGPPRITDEVLDRLTRLDYRNRFALVARAAGRGVAVARYSRLAADDEAGPAAAEIAVAVAPEWRRVGLASALIAALADRALECGIESFTALFLPSNKPVAELADQAHARVVVADSAATLYSQLVDPHSGPSAS
jgi:GNAT superfamily N-acetyltransferase